MESFNTFSMFSGTFATFAEKLPKAGKTAKKAAETGKVLGRMLKGTISQDFIDLEDQDWLVILCFALIKPFLFCYVIYCFNVAFIYVLFIQFS